jgi:hypothetical protein
VRARRVAREHARRYADWRHADTDVLRRLELRLLEAGSVTPADRTDTSQWDATLAEAHDNWDNPNRGFWKCLVTVSGTTAGAHVCFQTVVLYGCSFAQGYADTLQMKCAHTTFCGQTKRVYAWGCVRRPQQSPLGTGRIPFSFSVWAGTLGDIVVSCLTGRGLNSIVVMWELFSGSFLKTCL